MIEMKCPFCNSKMEKGEINQDRYSLKWKSENRSVKSVKLTSFLTKTYVEAYLCRDCNILHKVAKNALTIRATVIFINVALIIIF